MVRYYNRTNTCDNIKEDGKCEEKLSPRNANREYDEKGNWTGRWICKNCWNKNYYRDIVKKDPNSRNNLLKSITDHSL